MFGSYIKIFCPTLRIVNLEFAKLGLYLEPHMDNYLMDVRWRNYDAAGLFSF